MIIQNSSRTSQIGTRLKSKRKMKLDIIEDFFSFFTPRTHIKTNTKETKHEKTIDPTHQMKFKKNEKMLV